MEAPIKGTASGKWMPYRIYYAHKLKERKVLFLVVVSYLVCNNVIDLCYPYKASSCIMHFSYKFHVPSLTARRIFFLGNPFQMVKMFPPFKEPRRSNAVFAKPHQWSIFKASRIHPISWHQLSSSSPLAILLHTPESSKGVSSLCFLIKLLHTVLISSICHTNTRLSKLTQKVFRTKRTKPNLPLYKPPPLQICW